MLALTPSLALALATLAFIWRERAHWEEQSRKWRVNREQSSSILLEFDRLERAGLQPSREFTGRVMAMLERNGFTRDS